METAQSHKAPMALIFGRNIVGMALFALLNPLLYYDSQPVMVWLTGWAMALLVAAIAFGAYALFFTASAKSSWPRGFFMLAWAIAVLVVIGGWSEYNTVRNNPAPAPSSHPGLTPFTGKLDGE